MNYLAAPPRGRSPRGLSCGVWAKQNQLSTFNIQDSEFLILTVATNSQFLYNMSMSHERRSQAWMIVNATMIGVSITSFFLIGAIKPDLLIANKFFTLQLICSIPILFSSTVAFKRSFLSRSPDKFRDYAVFLYIIGYAFLINSIGIFVADLTTTLIAQVFFAVNIIMPLIYSYYRIKYDKSDLRMRFIKDGVYISILVVLGVLVAF
jgi:hypothetical protein